MPEVLKTAWAQWPLARRNEEYAKHDPGREPPTYWGSHRGRLLCALFHERKPRTILDIGCNSGFLTRWLLLEPSVERLVGVDPCQIAINRARQLTSRIAPGYADWREGSIFEQKFDTYFDLIVCCEVLEHFTPTEGEQLFDLIYDRLEPTGTALITSPSPHGPFGLHNSDQKHITLRNAVELELMARARGAASSEVTDHEGLLHLVWSKDERLRA
ncbi:MAG TPA: class I SAM-dependent methyltransferase [Reyranellaceae bacterium]|nr:class I SAM-dependent methyltransferase [Reyranellaceae bacterium]